VGSTEAAVHSLGLDAAGNLYLGGTFNDNATIGGFALTARNTLSTFLAKFNAAGIAQWAQLGGSIPFMNTGGGIYAHTLTVGPTGDIYLSWSMHPNAGGFGAVPPPAGFGDVDVTLVRFNTQGVVQWQKRYGTAGPDYAGVPALDGNGNLLVPMSFSGTGPATVGTQTLTGTGQHYGALLRLDASTGSLQWVQKLEATTAVIFRAAATDGAGNSYVAGSLTGTAQAGSQPLSSNGANPDVLVASYSAQGTPRWFQKSNGAQGEFATGIAINGNKLSVGGVFYQQGQFGSTTLTGAGTGVQNSFVAHFGALPTAARSGRPLALGFYPSPASDLVRMPGLAAGTPVQLLDALGRVARETTVSAAADVSVLGLAPGLYTLRATDMQGRQFTGHLAVE
jgi:hypothetical protein